MHKTKFILLSALVFSQFAFANITADQVVDGRSFSAALAGNKVIRSYMSGRTPATPEALVETLEFVSQVASRDVNINPRMTELLNLAGEIGEGLKEISPEVRERLAPIVNTLLRQFATRTKNDIVVRIMDRFWLWTPEHLDFMARKVRNDSSQLIATQLMWILENATPEERGEFFAQVPDRQANIRIRWFPLALALKYGRKIDERGLKRSLSQTHPDRLLPRPQPMKLNGQDLPTTKDLYLEMRAKVAGDVPGDDCAELLQLSYSPNLAPGPSN